MRQLLLTTAVLLALTGCGSDDAADSSVPVEAVPASEAGASAPAGDASASAQAGATATGKPEPKQANVYSRTFTKDRQSFQVDVTSNVSRSTVTITPKGLTLSNKPLSRDVHGLFTGAEMADLDADGNPEIYVYFTSSDGKRMGSLFAVASNQGRSMSEVSIPPLTSDAKNSVGYRGGDEFAVVEKVLARRFPLYDDSGEATGTMRQLQYKLIAGATPQLKLEHAAEF